MTDDHGGQSTVCPLCAVGCHLSRGEGARARGRAGPANPEGRLCRKGATAFEVVDGDDRLTTPKIREGGDLVAVSWERAYERVVDGLGTALAADGPDALAFLGAPHSTNEENYLLQKLARALGTNNVDNRARHCHVSTARALEERLGWPASTGGLEDLRGAEVILVVGANPAARQPVAFNSFVRPAVREGATLVHVDPVGNRTARAADVHLAPRPGTDAFVVDALCRRLLPGDREFVADRTAGFEAFAAGLQDLEVGTAASEAGVDADDIERVATAIRAADGVAAITGTGVENDDGATADALLNLLLLTGNVGRPGSGLFVFRGPPNEQGATDAGCIPDRLPGHQPIGDPKARARVGEEWGVEVPADPGLTAPESLAAFGESVRAAVVVGENPAVSKRDEAWVRERLDALETLVVIELAETETTPHADVLLPAAAGPEKTGTVTNLDRRVQRLRPVATPPEGVRTDFEILRELGTRLAPGDGRFACDSPAGVFAELSRVAPPYADLTLDRPDAGVGRWPAETRVLYREAFDTDDGRAPFVLADRQVEAPGEGLSLVVGGRAGDGTTDEDGLGIHPADARARGVESGDAVTVTDGERTVVATADVRDGVRRGTVALHAAVADPFVRADTATVTVAPANGNPE